MKKKKPLKESLCFNCGKPAGKVRLYAGALWRYDCTECDVSWSPAQPGITEKAQEILLRNEEGL